ncbi:MAG: hypothetical protein PHY46_03280, partial [Candidatus Omnitrophica bacterium]|nr:hypothetical protein [Candidatus Omnitrophota bacterium]
SILSYAMTQGALRFILRQPLDTAVESVPPIEANALWQYILSTLGQQLVTPAQPQKETQEPTFTEPVEPEKATTLEIYKGSKKEEVGIR